MQRIHRFTLRLGDAELGALVRLSAVLRRSQSDTVRWLLAACRRGNLIPCLWVF